MKRNAEDTQKFIDAYKEYFKSEECNDEYFDDFIDDFKAMEDCKTNGELADWLNDYIYNKGLESLYDIINGENEDFESVSEWIDEFEQFEDIALWVEQVANGEIDRDEPVSEDSRNELEERFALEEYESGDDFIAICHTAQTTGEGEKTMSNENFDLPTFGYSLEIGIDQLIDFAFDKTNGLDMKECLLEEMEYNSELFIERLEENLKLPITEEAEEVYYDIDLDEWSAILNVEFDREDADISDINDGRGGNNPTVTVDVDITVNMALFNDICEEHGLEIKSEMQSFTKKNMEEVFKNLYNAKKEGRGND